MLKDEQNSSDLRKYKIITEEIGDLQEKLKNLLKLLEPFPILEEESSKVKQLLHSMNNVDLK